MKAMFGRWLWVGPVLALAACGASGPSVWHIPTRHPQIRVTLRSGCPPAIVGYHDVKNPGGGLSNKLVPLNPRQGLICRYGPRLLLHGGGESGPALYRRSSLSNQKAADLARVIDDISTVGPPPGPVAACPADAGSASVIVFGYKSGPDADLWYGDAGCQTLDNSRIGAYDEGNPSFYRSFIPIIDGLSPLPT